MKVGSWTGGATQNLLQVSFLRDDQSLWTDEDMHRRKTIEA